MSYLSEVAKYDVKALVPPQGEWLTVFEDLKELREEIEKLKAVVETVSKHTYGDHMRQYEKYVSDITNWSFE